MKYFTLFSLLFSLQAFANWSLDNSQSALHFVSTKNAQVTELHKFDELSGTLNKAGQLEVTIKLASVDTGIDIRNTRMQSMLFLVEKFVSAKLTAQLPTELLSMPVGDTQVTDVKSQLYIQAATMPVTIKVQVTRTHSGFVASTVSPILLSTSALQLSDGVEALRKIAGLTSITQTVPVTFTVVFNHAD